MAKHLEAKPDLTASTMVRQKLTFRSLDISRKKIIEENWIDFDS